ncbi:F-box/kelch-repeat protein At3g23880-like [Silene latifolia]|uniref:F-box/kelch-repeat protein At3g23880-like n=1 Tax=Silene latifolia TaxID=37657 RepID=UPI003D789A8B
MLGSTTTIEKSIDLPKGIILDIESQMIGYTRTGSFFMTGTSNDQLGNIMLLLPIKSILKFKSVSKQWYFTLSSSDFATVHLIKSPLSHPSAPVNILFIQCCNNRYLFTYNDDDHISGYIEYNLLKLDVEFWAEKTELKFTGCCNGLICLTPPIKKYFIICNPATHKMHKYASDGYIVRAHVVCGFGYASSVDDYKYVRVSKVVDHMEKSNTRSSVHVFSLKENKCRNIDFDHDALTLFDPPVLLNETLYWTASVGI